MFIISSNKNSNCVNRLLNKALNKNSTNYPNWNYNLVKAMLNLMIFSPFIYWLNVHSVWTHPRSFLARKKILLQMSLGDQHCGRIHQPKDHWLLFRKSTSKERSAWPELLLAFKALKNLGSGYLRDCTPLHIHCMYQRCTWFVLDTGLLVLQLQPSGIRSQLKLDKCPESSYLGSYWRCFSEVS